MWRVWDTLVPYLPRQFREVKQRMVDRLAGKVERWVRWPGGQVVRWSGGQVANRLFPLEAK